jgi:hypothetical protein
MNEKEKAEDNNDIKMPICPFCKKEMFVTKFIGYYDEFSYWDCSCGHELPKEKDTCHGQFA